MPNGNLVKSTERGEQEDYNTFRYTRSIGHRLHAMNFVNTENLMG